MAARLVEDLAVLVASCPDAAAVLALLDCPCPLCSRHGLCLEKESRLHISLEYMTASCRCTGSDGSGTLRPVNEVKAVCPRVAPKMLDGHFHPTIAVQLLLCSCCCAVAAAQARNRMKNAPLEHIAYHKALVGTVQSSPAVDHKQGPEAVRSLGMLLTVGA